MRGKRLKFESLCFQTTLNSKVEWKQEQKCGATWWERQALDSGSESNLLIRQHTHPGMDATLQGAAMSDLLWGNGTALGMCSEAKVSWLLFELTLFHSLQWTLFISLLFYKVCHWHCFSKYSFLLMYLYSYIYIYIYTLKTVRFLPVTIWVSDAPFSSCVHTLCHLNWQLYRI